MSKRGYKRYLDPHSDETIPRTTLYNLRKSSGLQFNLQEILSSSIDRDDTEPSLFGNESMFEFFENHQSEEELTNSEPNWHQLDLAFDEDEEEYNEIIEPPDVGFDEEAHQGDRAASYLMREKLCNCTETTRGEAVMMALSLGAQHSLTWEAIIDILSMINALFGINVVPATKYLVFKYFPFPNDVIKYHLYCSQCQSYLGERSNLDKNILLHCDNCNQVIRRKELSFFITLSIRTQLQQLLEDQEIQKALLYKTNRTKKQANNLEDIYDGNMYKKFSAKDAPLENPYNLSYTFATDGCQTSKSGNTSAWPIYMMIHELPPQLREKHILMAGLWVSNTDPNMNLFMGKFTDEANSLATDGIQWTLINEENSEEDETITSKVIPIVGCFDSVARCKVLNMKQYNGYYGCTFCEHQGNSINGNIRFLVTEDIPADRTDESIKSAMVKVVEGDYLNESELKGVKGPSALMNLEHFDLADGMIPDYMHSILLGVIKQYTEILLTSVDTAYYVGNPTNLLQINRRLLSIKHPSCITRSPRPIEDRQTWKASEWRSWLIFYALICLNGILNRKYYNHLALLVTAVEILLSDSLSENMVERADELLIRFVVLYQQYFGEMAMTYNVHLLLHMRKSVLNWGPLWTHNAFCFENENKAILQLKKSPAHVALQITRKYLFFKSLCQLKKKIPTSQNFQIFCEYTLTNKLKNTVCVDNCVLIGNGKNYELTEEEMRLVNYRSSCKSFNRIIINGIRYTSESYRQCRKLNDSIIEMACGTKGIIKNICYFPEHPQKKIILFYRKIILSNEPFHSTRHVDVTHIRRCDVDDNIQIGYPETLVKQGYLITMRNTKLFVSIPKGCYKD